MANMRAIVAAAYQYANRVVVAILGPVGNSSAEQTLISSYNASLTGLSVDGFLRFDLALTVGNNGTTQNTALFNSDTIHPNPSGATAMYNRIAVDAPWLLD
jgi:lysophospholipase L1-like esterase